MAIWIEALSERLNAGHAVAFKHVEQLTLGNLDTVKKALECRILNRCLRRHMLDGAAKIVADGEHIAGKIGDRVACGVSLLTLGAAAQILHICHGAQQSVAHIGIFGYQRGQLRVRFDRRVSALLIGVGKPSLILRARLGFFVGHQLF